MTLQELQRLINFPKQEVLGTWVRAFEEYNINNSPKLAMQIVGNYNTVLDWHLIQHVGKKGITELRKSKRHFTNN